MPSTFDRARSSRATKILSLVWTFLTLSGLTSAQQPPSTTPTSVPAQDVMLPKGAVLRLGSAVFAAGGEVTALDFSADGSRLIGIPQGASTKIWDAATGADVRSFAYSAYESLEGACFVGSDLVATAWSSGKITLYDVHSGQVISEIQLGRERVDRLAGSRSGNRLLTISSTMVSLWNTATGERIADLGQVDPYSTRSPQFSADGKTIVASSRGIPRAWDALKGTPIELPKMPVVFEGHLAVSPDGSRFAIGTSKGLQVCDIKTGKETAPPLSENNVGIVRFSPKSNVVAYAVGSQLKFFDSDGGQPPSAELLPSQIHTFEWSPDGKSIAIALSGESVQVVDFSARKPVATRGGHRTEIRCLAVSPDGLEVVTGESDGPVMRWDAANGRLLASNPLRHGLEILSYSSAGDTIYRGGLIEWMNPQSLKITGTSALTGRRPEMSPNATLIVQVQESPRVLTPGANGMLTPQAETPDTARVRTVRNGEEILTFPLDWTMLQNFAFSPDNRELAVSEGRMIRVWDLTTRRLSRNIDDRDRMPAGIAWSPDGSMIGCADGAHCILYDARSGAVRWRTRTQTRRLIFSPDSSLVLTFSGDAAACLLDAESGALLAMLEPSARTRCAAFVNGTHQLVTGCSDGIAYVWDLYLLLPSVEIDPRATPEQLWAQLGSSAYPTRFHAARQLSNRPEQLLPLARQHVKVGGDFFAAQALVQKLSSPNLAEREAAHRALERAGAAAANAVAEAMRFPPQGEAGDRLRSLARLLADKAAPDTSLGRRQRLMLLQALEWLGTQEAASFLADAAKAGAPDAQAAASRIAARLRRPAATRSAP